MNAAPTREEQSGLPIGESVLASRRSALDEKLSCVPQKLSIRDARPLVLAQVLDPRFVHETFHEARGIGRVVKQLPEIRAVAAAHFVHGLHGGHELSSPGGLLPPVRIPARARRCYAGPTRAGVPTDTKVSTDTIVPLDCRSCF
jgi:hypothetical protein